MEKRYRILVYMNGKMIQATFPVGKPHLTEIQAEEFLKEIIDKYPQSEFFIVPQYIIINP